MREEGTKCVTRDISRIDILLSFSKLIWALFLKKGQLKTDELLAELRSFEYEICPMVSCVNMWFSGGWWLNIERLLKFRR